MEVQEDYKAVGIDYEAGLRRFVGNVALYEKYLYRFPQEQEYFKMCQAMQEKDYTEAFKQAHALKGVTATLGLTELYREVSELVEALRAGDTELAWDRLEPVRKSWKQVADMLEKQRVYAKQP